MKAVQLLEFGGQLVFDDLPVPAMASDEILVKVKSSAVNHLDLVKASGALRQVLPINLPWIPGHEFSGIVEQVGSEVAGYAAGDAVFGTSELGAYAEFLAVKPATQILARRTVKPLAKNESVTLSSDLFADLVPGTGRVAVSVGLSSALDAAALLAALDLSDGKTCEDYAKALPAVLNHGDERSLALMVALTHTDGCGDDRAQDCYPCLRETNTLTQAIEAVKQRPAPKH